MRIHPVARSGWRAALSLTTALSLLTSPLCVTASLADPPPLGGASATGAVPPALVGRIATLSGSVSYHQADDTAWSTAALNYPVSSGYSFWTEPGAGTTLQVASDDITLDGGTELDMTTLDSQTLLAQEPQGEAFLQVAPLPGQTITVQTPRGAVTLAQGRFLVAAGDANTPTVIDAIDGAAQVTLPGSSLPLSAGQSATLTGTPAADGSGGVTGSIGAVQRSAFLDRLLARAQPAASATPLPQPVQWMTGSSALAGYGSWTPQPSYGQVWFPQVSSGWAPYREGHWRYVAPWGWTWVDDEPWGFAPFHYGRWSQFDGRWGWVPADESAYSGPVEDQEPVYAPALVSFVDLPSAGLGFAAGAGAAAAIGWIALGPHERYDPPYRTDGNYLRRLNRFGGDNISNVSNVRNITNIRNNVTNINTVNNIHLVNAAYATALPASAMQQGKYGRGAGVAPRAVPAAVIGQARTLTGVPVRPVATTPGITPAVGRQLGLAPAADGRFGDAAAGRVAPAPALHPNHLPVVAIGAGAGAVAAAAALAHRAANPATPAIVPGRPGLPARPGQAGLPALRPNGGLPHAPGGAPGPAITTPVGREAAPSLAGRPPAATPVTARPVAAARPGELPHVVTPQTPAPGTVARPVTPGAIARPGEPARPTEAARPGLAPAAPHATPSRVQVARPVAARPATPTPRVETPRQAPRAEPPRPAAAARPEPARPAPAARPAPPHPAPRPAARPEEHKPAG